MGSLKYSSLYVEGISDRLVCMSRHLMHHQTNTGTVRTDILAIGRFLVKRVAALVKLH